MNEINKCIQEYYEIIYFKAFAYNSQYLNVVLQGNLDEQILNSDFVKKLHDLIKSWSDLNILSDDCKNNLYNIISYFRKKLPEFWKEYNEMIILLNKTTKENEFLLLKEEFCIRTIFSSLSTDYMTFIQNTDIVKKSIGYDFMYFDYLYNSSDEEFIKSLDELTMDIYFYMSICSFIYTIPDIFNDEIFLKRIRTIIKIDNEKLKNKKYIEQIEVSEKELRFIKSSNKYFNKNID